MARPLRIQFEGAIYHVTVRGNARQAIFLDEADQHRRLARLSECVTNPLQGQPLNVKSPLDS